jgi:hypothetical protein
VSARHRVRILPRIIARAIPAIAASFFALMIVAAPASALSVGGLWVFSQGAGQVVPDLSGHQLNATLGSSPLPDPNDPTWVRGAFFGLPALHFSGNSYLTVPDAPSLDSGQVTVGAVVRAGSSPGAYKYIAAKGAFQCSVASYGLYTGASGGLFFYVSNGLYSFTLSPDAGTQVWDGRWHLVVGTFDGSTVRLFVDGHQVGSGSPSTITIQYGGLDNNQFAIGDYLGGPCPTSLGFIGDMEGVGVVQGVVASPVG